MLQLAKFSWRKHLTALATAATAGLLAVPASAQMQTVDPDVVIDGDLQQGSASTTDTGGYGQSTSTQSGAGDYSQELPPTQDGTSTPSYPAEPTATTAAEVPEPAAGSDTTYGEDDLIGAAEGLFGKGAEGLARMIENILKDQGEPNAYIVGREGGGALVVGVRYGSGTLHHKIEGNMPIYWTGPSIGFDAGANASNTFVLVYNVYDTEELYERFPAGEGAAYFVGGFNASYLRKGDIVLIPIRVGAGLRLGVNAGYMKFSHKQNWLPF